LLNSLVAARRVYHGHCNLQILAPTIKRALQGQDYLACSLSCSHLVVIRKKTLHIAALRMS
jgi:hypothetical protein